MGRKAPDPAEEALLALCDHLSDAELDLLITGLVGRIGGRGLTAAERAAAATWEAIGGGQLPRSPTVAAMSDGELDGEIARRLTLLTPGNGNMTARQPNLYEGVTDGA